MDIEIVGFYPYINLTDKKTKLLGTLHIYIVDQDIDLRGIRVFAQSKKALYFRLPYMTGFDEDTEKFVEYPVMSFATKAKYSELLEKINIQGAAFVKKNHPEVLNPKRSKK